MISYELPKDAQDTGGAHYRGTNLSLSEEVASSPVKWTWACRLLQNARPQAYSLDRRSPEAPKPSDVALFRVDSIGNHSKLVMADNRKLQIYSGDLIVGVFGNRYATDAFEAEVRGLDNISILTAGGMIGTVLSNHRSASGATKVTFEGFLCGERGERLNLKEVAFRKLYPKLPVSNLILVVGTGMNSGKTTSCVKIIKGLSERGITVAACKLTGSVSNRDQDEMKAAGAVSVSDFSDYGFASTYLAGRDELVALLQTMLSEAEKKKNDVLVMEIADGLLQRETAMLLADPALKNIVGGLVLSADSAPSALFAADRVAGMGYRVLAVTGAFTSSPLSMKEFRGCSGIEVASSAGSGWEIANAVHKFITEEVDESKVSDQICRRAS
ncbi:MAG: hypothetical protein ACT4NX_04705 [Deltaproteobacteria bacterium]